MLYFFFPGGMLLSGEYLKAPNFDSQFFNLVLFKGGISNGHDFCTRILGTFSVKGKGYILELCLKIRPRTQDCPTVTEYMCVLWQ